MSSSKKYSYVHIRTIALIVIFITSPAIADFTRDIGKVVFKYEANDGLFLNSARYWNEERHKNFSAELGVGLSHDQVEELWPLSKGEGLLLRLGEATTLELQPSGRAGECASVTWTSQELTEIRDCIDYGTAQWFGAFEQREQVWPVQKLPLSNYAYVTKSIDNMGVAERFWLNSEGVYIYIEPYVPLFIDANATGDNKLCFVAKFDDPFKPVTDLRLHYQVCTLPTAVEAHVHALNSVLNSRPSELPDLRMVRDPIWSTWARYRARINETIVLNFAQEILDYGYSNSQLEIDDNWEVCYGELVFDPEKFPDPPALMGSLNTLGFRVTLWIHPFVNEDCPSFDSFKQAGYFAKDENGTTRTSWWKGARAGIVDFSNSNTVAWFLDRVRTLKTYAGLDSFKFDAGETNWLPEESVLAGSLDLQPILFTTEYVNSFSEFAPLAEVRAGFRTQDSPLFIRMVDKDSNWSLHNGLKTIVTTLLAMTTAGYSYIMPDMIGGNGYILDGSADLFVRWLQASTFMPTLQFSFVPWDFNDTQVEAICKRFVDLHSEYAATIMDYANKSIITGIPINRPVWYADETLTDQQSFAIDDEYMLGDEILVAPVMDEGATSRDIYLPPGVWQDMNTGTYLLGGVWIRNYPAPLDVLPYFKLTEGMSAATLVQTSAVTMLLVAALVMLVT